MISKGLSFEVSSGIVLPNLMMIIIQDMQFDSVSGKHPAFLKVVPSNFSHLLVESPLADPIRELILDSHPPGLTLRFESSVSTSVLQSFAQKIYGAHRLQVQRLNDLLPQRHGYQSFKYAETIRTIHARQRLSDEAFTKWREESAAFFHSEDGKPEIVFGEFE